MGSHLTTLGRAKLAAALAALATLGLAPAAAQAASTVTVTTYTTYKIVNFQAAANVANRVVVSSTSSSVTITDPADTITEAEADCTGTTTNTVTCTSGLFGAAPLGATNSYYLDVFGTDTAQNDTFSASGPLGSTVNGYAGNDVLSGSPADSREQFEGGDGNDVIDTRGGTGALSNSAFGGAGDDELTGGPSRDSLNGEAGKDTLRAGGGDDSLRGGPGDGDVLEGEGGDDTVSENAGDGAGDVHRGGTGIDTLFYFPLSSPAPAVGFSLDLDSGVTGLRSGSEQDSSTGFEDVTTGRGSDLVLGTGVANNITTSEGNDTVDGRAGADFVTTSEGDDTVAARDGSPDRVRCGDGLDSVTADQFDETSDCENVTRAQVTPVQADGRAPRCKILRVRSRYSRLEFLRGLRPRIDCNERFAAKMRLQVRVRGASALIPTGGVVLRERRLRLGGDRRVRLKASRRIRRALGNLDRGFRATIRLEASDAAGNRRVATKRIRVG